jgi:hypothetical protein
MKAERELQELRKKRDIYKEVNANEGYGPYCVLVMLARSFAAGPAPAHKSRQSLRRGQQGELQVTRDGRMSERARIDV